MTALIIQIATSLAEAYLSKRLNGVRVRLDASKLLAEFGDRKAGSRVGRLMDDERRLADRLKKIRPKPNGGAFAFNERGQLGMITGRDKETGEWLVIQLGEPAGKNPGGPWKSLDPSVVGHRLGLVAKKER